jgi:hypothetical protein
MSLEKAPLPHPTPTVLCSEWGSIGFCLAQSRAFGFGLMPLGLGLNIFVLSLYWRLQTLPTEPSEAD